MATVKKTTNEYRQLTDFINQLYGKKCNWKIIAKQIQRYIEEDGLTYAQIAKCLYWFYVIEQNPIEKSNGHIGIVPYAVAGTREYYKKLSAANAHNEKFNVKKDIPIKEITIKSPRVEKDIELFEF